MERTVYYSGIDLHKRTAVIHTIDAEGCLVKQATLKTYPAALATYFAAPARSPQAVVESTIGWYWPSELLGARGVKLKLAHATDLKAISHAKVKTDRVDAAMLAQLLRIDMIPEAFQLNPELRGQRDLLRTRLKLVQRKTNCLNSVERVLEKYNVRHAEDLPELYRMQIGYHLKQALLLKQQITEIEHTLRGLLKSRLALHLLSQIPGIGTIGAATILLKIGDIERFPSERQFFSYCRLVPGADNTGGRLRHRSGHKAGNKYLKLAFSHAAVRAIQHYPVIRDAYRNKRRKKHPCIARSWVAKELARTAYYVLRDQKDFDGRFKGKPLSRTKTPPSSAETPV
jgi:transposase